MQQADMVKVGNQSKSPCNVSVTFNTPFESVPVVVANAIQNDPAYPNPLPDTFTVSITSITKSGFTANIYRVDLAGGGWGQQLNLGYIASTGYDIPFNM